jgi:hypothetical protein
MRIGNLISNPPIGPLLEKIAPEQGGARGDGLYPADGPRREACAGSAAYKTKGEVTRIGARNGWEKSGSRRKWADERLHQQARPSKLGCQPLTPCRAGGSLG